MNIRAETLADSIEKTYIPRIRELETENARLREALQRIADYQGRFAEDDPQSIAHQALNQAS